MTPPISNFTYEVSGLILNLKDASMGGELPISKWAWSFGDGSSGSTQESPSHTYSEAGVYLVTLTTTIEYPNPIGELSSSKNMFISIEQTTERVVMHIKEKVRRKMPGLYDEAVVNSMVDTWQLYLFPQIEPPVAQKDLHDELAWPPMVNLVIADLICYELILDTLQGGMGGLGASVASAGGAGGGLKSIETGPSKTEWHGISDSAKTIALVMGTSSGGKSPLDELRDRICMWAKREKLNLPFCVAIKHNYLFDKASKPQSQNPLLRYKENG